MSNEKYIPKYPVEKKDFSPRLIKLREKKGYAKGEFADLLGVDRGTYSSWENAEKDTYPKDYNILVGICELLDADLQYLLTGLFGENRDNKHDKIYLDIYDRYKKDADFHYLVTALFGADEIIIDRIIGLVEAIDTAYRGEHPMLEEFQ